MIEIRPIGLFKMWDEKGPDEKVLCVPIRDPLWNHIKSYKDVSPHLLKKIAHFFKIYKDLENKKTGIEGWQNAKVATRIIETAKKCYLRNKK